MSVFSSIMSRIFGHKTAEAATPEAGAAPAPGAAPEASPGATAGTPPGATPPGATSPGATSGAAPAAAPAQPVDVSAVLSDMAAKNPQKLNWRESIVDLMKLLGLDSSLENRKELAKELNYSGDTGDSAAMNIWLHKQVMTKLAENGGKVPEELKG
ncbi:DUF3597 domain-containing protein [Roseomonas sp. KE0001]|uniref:DUF3597 domain-containing protein n=1 Tax=Roseomonas sp. KE0001 TaxID=2479201 RepID=UPI0018DFA5F1|nr:DUF3597 domain-containing protein [Roseomonas sp. KE0001]MBI0435102.1 DUF3597 domain-containing protein [Roseomonas sp. KE0001]